MDTRDVLTAIQAVNMQPAYFGCSSIVKRHTVQAYSERAGEARGTVEVEDVLTAIQARAAFSFVQPPSQDVSASFCSYFSTL